MLNLQGYGYMINQIDPLCKPKITKTAINPIHLSQQQPILPLLP